MPYPLSPSILHLVNKLHVLESANIKTPVKSVTKRISLKTSPPPQSEQPTPFSLKIQGYAWMILLSNKNADFLSFKKMAVDTCWYPVLHHHCTCWVELVQKNVPAMSRCSTEGEEKRPGKRSSFKMLQRHRSEEHTSELQSQTSN